MSHRINPRPASPQVYRHRIRERLVKHSLINSASQGAKVNDAETKSVQVSLKEISGHIFRGELTYICVRICLAQQVAFTCMLADSNT